MTLWIRYKTAKILSRDKSYKISSEVEWKSLIHNPNIVSTILCPENILFKISGDYLIRRHPLEKNYQKNSEIDASFNDVAYEHAKLLGH